MLELESPENQQYAASLGISDAMVLRMANDVRARRVHLADLAGFGEAELEALHQHGMQLLNAGEFEKAGETFFCLLMLRPSEARFYRTMGMVFHHQRNFGWARQYDFIAHKLDESDVIAMALLGETQLYTGGKRFAHAWLTKALAKVTTEALAEPYLARAENILSKLVL